MEEVTSITQPFFGKIIRDAIHSDIFIENKFLQVIDTPEFQRLRRIKQLSVANIVFPSADHTRFSHSIGCFFVMKQLIAHFKNIFNELGIPIQKEDEDIALLAALLHDIGHGPFSHAFEEIYPKCTPQISHEEWTTRIIMNESGTLNQAIETTFGQGTAKKVSELIRKQREVKKSENIYTATHIDLFTVLSSLISSQLDADRLDYLVRDAYGCGVSFGKIDISRIISSFSITVHNNNYVVCIPEKYLDDIETYLFARYHMQSVVYYHDMKVQMEQVIVKIFRRAQALYQEHKLTHYPSNLEKLFENTDIQIEDYIKVDDTTLWCAFQEWEDSSDPILSKLCRTILYRQKSKKINALDNSMMAYKNLRDDFCKLLTKYNYSMDEQQLCDSVFWLDKKYDFSAYKKKKENIWILKGDGTIEDISKCSRLLQTEDDQVLLSERERVWINYPVLKSLSIDHMSSFIEEVNMLINNYDIRNTIEIEKNITLAMNLFLIEF